MSPETKPGTMPTSTSAGVGGAVLRVGGGKEEEGDEGEEGEEGGHCWWFFFLVGRMGAREAVVWCGGRLGEGRKERRVEGWESYFNDFSFRITFFAFPLFLRFPSISLVDLSGIAISLVGPTEDMRGYEPEMSWLDPPSPQLHEREEEVGCAACP